MARCEQKKCGFLNTSLCPQCRSCGSPSNILDDNCVDCWNCSHDEGYIRGRVRGNKEQLFQIVKNEETEIMEIKQIREDIVSLIEECEIINRR